MPALATPERRQLLEVVRALFDDPDPIHAGQALSAIGTSPAFHADAHWVLEIDYGGRTGHVLDSRPGWVAGRTPPGFAMPHDLVVNHPFFTHYAQPSAFLPERAGTVVSPRAWHHSAARSVIDEMLGTPNQLLVPLRREPRLECILLMRSGADFTADDVELARRVQPLLVAADRHIAELARWRTRPADQAPDSAVLPIEPVTDLDVTPRELVVLRGMADGLTTASIARRLHVSARTVRRQEENLRHKLGTADRVSTVLWAERLGLLGRSPESDS
ncbi:helix-turn-helix transcriptional regulator [Pseudonocardia sp. GCM10023141]|uniref:helix-turn-helix transcriptional regulator n=1 Tax=Pseudonocardia sp. GCM10023141 TaxID=3252653 RepID=UPI003623AA39